MMNRTVAFQRMKLVNLEVCKAKQLLTKNLCINYFSFPLHLKLIAGTIMSCENGQQISVYGKFCNENQGCPLGIESLLALTSNCSKSSNHFCPISSSTAKICIDRVDVSITNYCSYGARNDSYWKCPKANKGLEFEQC